jgi:hypothetical protein
MANCFNDALLQKFMNTFYGYGNYAAPYWFIGMEEGGGDSYEEVARRLTVWDKRGRRELEDVAGYHIELGITYPFEDKPRLQPTWAKLIRVLLCIEGEPPTRETVRSYQQQYWARSDGNVNLMELLPLPSPSTRHWLYADYSALPELRSRDDYRQTWSVSRTEGLRERIKAHQPKAVIFYSFGYLSYWNEITNAKLQPALAGAIYAHDTHSTLFVVLKHPAAKGADITSEYFHEAGRFIHSELAAKQKRST